MRRAIELPRNLLPVQQALGEVFDERVRSAEISGSQRKMVNVARAILHHLAQIDEDGDRYRRWSARARRCSELRAVQRLPRPLTQPTNRKGRRHSLTLDRVVLMDESLTDDAFLIDARLGASNGRQN
jgi:hypothetical protein